MCLFYYKNFSDRIKFVVTHKRKGHMHGITLHPTRPGCPDIPNHQSGEKRTCVVRRRCAEESLEERTRRLCEEMGLMRKV